jgi:hypothetical protein
LWVIPGVKEWESGKARENQSLWADDRSAEQREAAISPAFVITAAGSSIV